MEVLYISHHLWNIPIIDNVNVDSLSGQTYSKIEKHIVITFVTDFILIGKYIKIMKNITNIWLSYNK